MKETLTTVGVIYVIDKKRKLGKHIGELEVGDSYTLSRTIEDRDLLLYLGLTDDANPLYIQYDYASQTPYNQPIVPSVMLFGLVSAVVSMHLPGPGSHITQHEMIFPTPLYHRTELKLTVEVIAVDETENHVALSVIGFNNNGDEIINGKLYASPPYQPNSLTSESLKNFYK